MGPRRAARSISTVVFWRSCIYGYHQCGTEDQGWATHFLISALKESPITIYGDGKQVRDILFVEDLGDALLLANVESLSDGVFNIGGDPENMVSLSEILEVISDKIDGELPISYEDWRQGNQLYYDSDTSKFKKATGCSSKIYIDQGIKNIMDRP